MEYPIIKQGVNQSLENVSSTLSLIDSSQVPLKELYNEFTEQMVSLLVNGIEKGSSKKFHESLKFFEKLGGVSKEKALMYENNLAIKKGVAACTAYIILNIAPSLLNGLSVKHNLYLFQKFYVSGIAYINQEDTTRTRQNITRLFMPYKIKKYDELFEKYGKSNVRIDELPRLNINKVMNPNVSELEQRKMIAGNILRACDLQEDKVRRRAEDFLDAYFRLSHLEVERVIMDTTDQNDFLSNFIVFNAVTGEDVFRKLCDSIEKGRIYADYNIENDPYRKIRQSRVQLLNSGIKVTSSALSSIVPGFKPAKVFVDMSADLLACCVDTPDMKTAIKINKIKNEMREQVDNA